MSMHRLSWPIAIAGSVLTSTALAADGESSTSSSVAEPTVSVGGFIRADYGAGDRYPEERGEDRTGVSKAALAVTAKHQDITGVLVVGTERLTDGNSDADGNVDVKDAFIVIGSDAERGFSWSVGAQPLLFGLKPNGYPGDRSLQPSIEYGGAGGFAVSNQAGPSLIGSYRFDSSFSIRFGAFDLDSSNATGLVPADGGSQITDNLFVQVRAQDLFGSGWYATMGAESLYVGGAVDSNKPVVATGVGFKHGAFDSSVEIMRLDRDIVGTTDDEQYLVTEVSYALNPQWTLYADRAAASELDAATLRVGAHYKFTRLLGFSFEYSKDDFDRAGASDVDSVDVRFTLSY